MRLIDADDLFRKISDCWVFPLFTKNYTEADKAAASFRQAIINAPTIDAKPVVHGRWIYPYGDDHTIAVCSNCKGVVYVNDAYNLLPPIDEVKYCYHCSAKMDEVIA